MARVAAVVLEVVAALEEEEGELVLAMDLDLELVGELAPGAEEVSVVEAGSVEEEVVVSVGGRGTAEGLALVVDSEEEEALGVGVASEAVVEEAAEWEEGPGMEVGSVLV